MKRTFFILLIGILSLNFFSSCSDDETKLTGTLSVSFNNNQIMELKIYTLESNKQYPLYELETDRNGDLSISLNMGNYLMVPSNYRYDEISFQICPDKTVSISYDENGTHMRK
ncbi:hypothetical protein [uncultured Bacteroides sp.]|uniref:hypothetical protein n=1 Tax=uncultured Bacteroides sp. TaxID=162156 RepID=UPI00261B9806|nr:hypothetical protein [uncultured Bacteroides sp.]